MLDISESDPEQLLREHQPESRFRVDTRENQTPPEAEFGLLLDLMRKANIYLSRPMVLIQLVSIVVGLCAAWFVSGLLWALIPRVGQRIYQRPRVNQRLKPLAIRTRALSIRGNRAWRAIRSVGNWIYSLIKAITFPLLGYLVITWLGRWLGERGVLVGLLLKTEWVIAAILIYSVTAAVLRQLIDKDEARFSINFSLRPALATGLGLVILHHLANIWTLSDVVLIELFNSPITVGALFLTTIGLYLWSGFVRILQDVCSHIIVAATDIEEGEVKATFTLIRYVLILLAIGYLFTQFEFDSTTMAAITGGLSVGIGFALREILGNFISGFILLFERTLHHGDIIEVDNQISVVENFTIRATTVRTRNNEEMIIPNQTFFTSSFKTYTGTDNMVRDSLMIQTDCVIVPIEVIKLLEETALTHPKVLDDPPPKAVLLEYGNNVATFELFIWIDEPMGSPIIMSDLRLAVWDRLKENGIALPFPEVELHFPKAMLPSKGREDGLPII
ncbi:MAG: mechanosensitive ion channel domain-containing protein [Chloroflexota bacterium]